MRAPPTSLSPIQKRSGRIAADIRYRYSLWIGGESVVAGGPVRSLADRGRVAPRPTTAMTMTGM
jgi:hypothetical protein